MHVQCSMFVKYLVLHPRSDDVEDFQVCKTATRKNQFFSEFTLHVYAGMYKLCGKQWVPYTIRPFLQFVVYKMQLLASRPNNRLKVVVITP